MVDKITLTKPELRMLRAILPMSDAERAAGKADFERMAMQALEEELAHRRKMTGAANG